MSAGQEWILPFVKWVHFFLGPWLLVYQFIEISNQMEANGKVLNFEKKNLYNSVLNKFFHPKFVTSPFTSIWLEISINCHTKSQGPMKKCTHFTKGRIHSCPADTARNYGSFTTHALWSVKSFNSPTVYQTFSQYFSKVLQYYLQYSNKNVLQYCNSAILHLQKKYCNTAILQYFLQKGNLLFTSLILHI